MCNFSDFIEQRGIEKGLSKGMKKRTEKRLITGKVKAKRKAEAKWKQPTPYQRRRINVGAMNMLDVEDELPILQCYSYLKSALTAIKSCNDTALLCIVSFFPILNA